MANGPVGIRVVDADRLKALAERLERFGANRELDKRIAKALHEAAIPIVRDTRAHAQRILPRRGGLAGIVAAQPMPITMASSGRWKGVRITARPGRGRGGVNDPAAINRGRVRHPAWGRERRDGQPIIQLVQAGWFSVPMAKGADKARERILGVIEDAIEELQG